MNKYFTQDGLPTFFLWFECKYLGQPNIFGDVAFDNCYDKKLPLDISIQASEIISIPTMNR